MPFHREFQDAEAAGKFAGGVMKDGGYAKTIVHNATHIEVEWSPFSRQPGVEIDVPGQRPIAIVRAHPRFGTRGVRSHTRRRSRKLKRRYRSGKHPWERR